jgi:hypothetical protein
MSTPTARLVVCFDGTDNTQKDRTNVWRIHELMAGKGADGSPQIKKYIEGVGTEFGSLVRGSIFGTGVTKKIEEGYRWLAEQYQAGAEIYVFGFSRGAFTARSLVQMVANCGLVRRAALKEWDERRVFERYEQISMQETEVVHPIWRLVQWQQQPADAPKGWKPDADERFLLDPSQVDVVKIRMAGLWDTVGAIGLDNVKNEGASTQKSAEHNVRPTKAQEYGYHAVAIDEHRPMFGVTLWRVFVPDGADHDAIEADWARFYEQRWFVGAHSDVGGGYGDDRLPDITLRWIMEKASALGLTFLSAVEPPAGAYLAEVHDSFKKFAGGVLNLWNEWTPGDQRYYRPIDKPPRPMTTAQGVAGELWSIHETIDDSVLKRFAADPTYRPPELVRWLESHPDQQPAGTTLAQRTQRIRARDYWNATGVFLRAGVQYRARVVPGVGEPLRDKDQLSHTIAGEDWNGFTYRTAAILHGKRKNDAKWFALIGTVDQDHPWAITDGGIFTVPIGGQLLCYFNDLLVELEYRDNSGWVLLDVEEVR